jgi:hypothetical protein
MAIITNSICTNNAEIDIQSGSASINIGTSSSGGESITIGNLNGATGIVINSGTDHMNLVSASNSNIVINAGNGLTLDSVVNLSVNSSGGDILIGNNNVSHDIEIGNSTSNRVVTLGSSSGTSQTVIQAGATGLSVLAQGPATIATNGFGMSFNTNGNQITIVDDSTDTPVSIGSGVGSSEIDVRAGADGLSLVAYNNGNAALTSFNGGVTLTAVTSDISLVADNHVSINPGTGLIVQTFTTTGALVSDASGNITDADASTAGFVLTSNGAGSVPTFQSITAEGAITEVDGNSGSATPTSGVLTISGDSTVVSTSGSGSTLSISSTAARVFHSSSGDATASSNAITIVGATGISTSASGSTLTITGTATSITLAGNSGSISGSSFTLSGSGVISSAASGSTVAFTSTAANTINSTSGSATASSNAFTIVGASGITTSATGSTLTITGTGSAVVNSVNGNSGTATPSAGVLTVTGDGTVLSTSGSGSTLSLTSTAARVFHSGSGDATASSNAITITGTGPISTTATSATLTIATSAANSIATDSGTATASSNAFTISGSGSVSTSASGSTITITGSGGGFTWNNTTGSTQTMAVGNGYVSNDGATLVTFTLPSTAAVGSLVAVQGAGSGLWTIAQNSGQTIAFNAVTSTSGATGSVSSTSQFDSITLICITANTGWAVNQATGNLSVV